MTDETFEAFIARDRARLDGERAAVFEKQHALEVKLAEINRELEAIDAYESAKSGRATSPRATGGRSAPRVRRGSKREELLAFISQHPGVARKDILEGMGLRGDKAGEMSVSNALTAMTKSSQVVREDGRYRVG